MFIIGHFIIYSGVLFIRIFPSGEVEAHRCKGRHNQQIYGAHGHYLIFAQLSLRVQVRLKTGWPGVLSRSVQK